MHFASREQFTAWMEGKIPRPETVKFRYYCARCNKNFESTTAPKVCPEMHKAVDACDRVTVTDNGIAEYTFPFEKPLEEELQPHS